MTLTPTEEALIDALRHGRRVPTLDLIHTVWPDRRFRPDEPFGNVRVHIYNLRAKLRRCGWVIDRGPRGYQLSPAPAGRPEVVESAASAKPSMSTNSPAAPVAGTFSISEDLLMHPPARAGASENTRPSSRPMISPMPSISQSSASPI